MMSPVLVFESWPADILHLLGSLWEGSDAENVDISWWFYANTDAMLK